MKLTLPCRSFSIHASRSNKSQSRSIDDDHEKCGSSSVMLQRTLLCRLIVNSRVTTSAMADRVFLPAVWTLDISVEC